MQQKIEKILHANNIASTPQRVAVGNVFFVAPTHLSADQVLSQVDSSGSPVSKATVYNTLRLFVDSGLLREINVNPKRLFYDSRTDPHHHTRCLSCGSVSDIPGHLPDGFLQDLHAGSGAFQVMGYRLELTGYCVTSVPALHVGVPRNSA